jgi:hypothetical protein
LVVLAVLKGVLFVGLVSFGVTKPFAGTNANEIVFPIAERIIKEHRFNGADSRPDSKMAPAYPFLIAALEAVKMPAIPVVVVLLQMMADAVTSLCLLYLGLLLCNVIAGGIAGLVWSLYPPAVIISTWIAQEPIFTALLMGSLVLVIASLSESKPTARLSLAAGVLMGLATLFRATPLLIPAALLPAWIAKRKFFDALVFVAGLLILVIPWTIRNLVVLQDRIPVATGTGSVFLLGSDDDQVHSTEKKTPFFAEAVAEGARNGILKPNPEYESAIDRWLFRLGLMRYRQRLERRPLSFLKLLGLKSLRLWYATDTARLPAQVALGLFSLPVVPLGLWRVWRWRKTNRVFFLVVGGVLVYFIGMHIVLLPLERYVIPIYPLLILASSQWLCGPLSLSLSRESRPGRSTPTLAEGAGFADEHRRLIRFGGLPAHGMLHEITHRKNRLPA